jgi:glycosyltransferase involved in cell wall biosynthesis
MRILFFIDCLGAGGKERRLIELMKAIKSDPEVDFELVIMSNEIHYKEVFELGININYLIRRTKKDLSVFVKLYKLCKRYKPDIIHCWDSMTAIYCAPVCRLLQIKNVNGMVIDSPGRRKILYKPWIRARITFPFAHLIIGNSRAGLAAYNAPANKSVVIYNGFNFARRNNIKSGSKIREELNINSEYIVGMVAAYSEFKDYPIYFKAAHLVLNNRKDVIFLAIGKNTDSELSRSHIDIKYLSHFRLLGKKSDIESYVNVMDIGVLATFTEGISNSILEYMAFGKPAVATAGGGTNEIIEDQKTGYLVNPSNPKELAEKISILLEDPALRSKMGRNGEARIHEVFSIETMTDEYLTEYKKLLSN